MDRSQYFASGVALDADTLLSDWRWLIGISPYAIHRVTAFGGLFLQAASGEIYFLDTTDANFRRIAGSTEELEALWEDREARRYLLKSYLVRELRHKGIVLPPGKCYSWQIPPHLGGEPSPDNAEVTDLFVHVSVSGQLHRQTRALPPGSTVDRFLVDVPEPPDA